jgi:hypothetical protein
MGVSAGFNLGVYGAFENQPNSMEFSIFSEYIWNDGMINCLKALQLFFLCFFYKIE